MKKFLVTTTILAIAGIAVYELWPHISPLVDELKNSLNPNAPSTPKTPVDSVHTNPTNPGDIPNR